MPVWIEKREKGEQRSRKKRLELGVSPYIYLKNNKKGSAGTAALGVYRVSVRKRHLRECRQSPEVLLRSILELALHHGS